MQKILFTLYSYLYILFNTQLSNFFNIEMEIHMLSSYIKICFIIFCSLLIFKKIFKKSSFKYLFYDILLCISSSFIFYIALQYFPFIYMVLLILTLLIYCLLLYKIPIKITLTAICISIALSYSAFLISTIMLVPILYPIYIIADSFDTTLIISHIFASILQILLSIGAFKIKRFKSGMPFLSQRTCNDTGLIISIFVLRITTLYYSFSEPNTLFLILVLTSILLCTTIVIWWRHNLNKAYWDAVHKNQIAALETEIINLKRDNDNLSKIIHKDNKLIPAMVLSVKELLEMSIALDNPSLKDISELKVKAAKLLEELEEISKERKGIMIETEQHLYELPKSNFMRLDSLISYLYQRCILFQIQFQALFNININQLMSLINERELDTIIADLIENAIYATKNQENKKILFCIDSKDNVFYMNIYDTGVPFNTDIIHKLGKNKATSHSNDGGSGIGLYNTISVCQKYSFSFIIEEAPGVDNFTKKISITFDDKNLFLYNGMNMAAS